MSLPATQYISIPATWAEKFHSVVLNSRQRGAPVWHLSYTSPLPLSSVLLAHHPCHIRERNFPTPSLSSHHLFLSSHKQVPAMSHPHHSLSARCNPVCPSPLPGDQPWSLVTNKEKLSVNGSGCCYFFFFKALLLKCILHVLNTIF